MGSYGTTVTSTVLAQWKKHHKFQTANLSLYRWTKHKLHNPHICLITGLIVSHAHATFSVCTVGDFYDNVQQSTLRTAAPNTQLTKYWQWTNKTWFTNGRISVTTCSLTESTTGCGQSEWTILTSDRCEMSDRTTEFATLYLYSGSCICTHITSCTLTQTASE